MAAYSATAVEDRTDYSLNLIEVQVEESDDVLSVDVTAQPIASGRVELRLTIQETLALIQTLTEAVTAAVTNAIENRE